MQTETVWKKPGATIIGTGLIALDVVINERRKEEPKLWTGGTCGNVLAVLAYLGWRVCPVARLGDDAASRLLRKDLRRWNADLRFASLPPQVAAPIIVHRLRRNARGENFHTFSLNCPGCGGRLPAYKPVGVGAVQDLPSPLSADVFFSDRLSPGIVMLAEKARAAGSIVVFEPSGVGDESLFQQMLALTHILKYSEERLPDAPVARRGTVPLEIQTLGVGGLRYRSRLPRSVTSRWVRVEAFDVDQIRDTAGAGDWCTAGLIHTLAASGLRAFLSSTERQVTDAVVFAQAVAAWNCGFEGARGGMYETRVADFQRSVDDILRTRSHKVTVVEDETILAENVAALVCTACRQTGPRPFAHRQLALRSGVPS
jgi:fructokinase